MEVVKKGRPQRGWSKEYTCTGKGNGNGGCGAVLLVSEYDIYETSSSALSETDYYNTFCCPECGVETDVGHIPITKKGTRPTPEERKKIAHKNFPQKAPGDTSEISWHL